MLILQFQGQFLKVRALGGWATEYLKGLET